MTIDPENTTARQTADHVLRRDRRRIRTLVVLSIGLWVLSAMFITSVYLPIGATLNHYGRLLQASAPAGGATIHYDPEHPEKLPPAPVPTTQEMPAVVADLRLQ